MSGVPYRIDLTGLLCPLPILLAAREMRKLREGDLLEILGDDPGIREDMPVWCERAGHRLLEMVEEGGQIRSLVEKGGRPPTLDFGPLGC
ncbi:MAG TPA: sulfurtransferase TusA family protein [Thermoanaerobaculia bacterium]